MEQEQAETATRAVGSEAFDQALQWIALGLEAAGVAVIVLGALAAVAIAITHYRRDSGLGATYHLLRTSLARGILLGLEFLVAADIVGTVTVEPTLEKLAVLGLIVLIRTFLSFSLEVEIEGRWPWQRRRDVSPESESI